MSSSDGTTTTETADGEAATSSAPVGQTVAQEQAAALKDPAERAEHERLAGFEKLARLVIVRRAQLGISQADLARRMGTSAPVVSRIESGQHATNTATLKRLAEALQGRALLGFEFDDIASDGTPSDGRKLVRL